MARVRYKDSGVELALLQFEFLNAVKVTLSNYLTVSTHLIPSIKINMKSFTIISAIALGVSA